MLEVFFMVKILALLTMILFCGSTYAAQVLKIKGKAVLIDNDGSNPKPGELYYLMNINNKKIGIIKIMKTQPGKSIAKLLKGKAQKRAILMKRPSSKATKKSTANKKKKQKAPKLYSMSKRARKKPSRSESKMGVGFNIGYNSNSSEVSFLDQTGALSRVDSYTGTSISYELFFDYDLFKRFNLRGTLGMHNFSAEDSENTQCEDQDNQPGAKCIVDLSYINIDLWARYYITQSWHKIWLGAGLGILLSPSQNSTTALNTEDVATTTLMQVGGGADININKKLYLPITAEYGLYPSSDTVDMSSVSFYFGLGYRL